MGRDVLLKGTFSIPAALTESPLLILRLLQEPYVLLTAILGPLATSDAIWQDFG